MSCQTTIYNIVLEDFKSRKGWYVTVTFSVHKDSGYWNWFHKQAHHPSVFTCMLSYDETSEIFEYSEAITKSPATEGIIKNLQDLKEGKEYGNFVIEAQLRRLIEALNIFWD